MDHRKSERVDYRNGIQDFQSFGQSQAQRFSSVQLLFCSKQISAVLSIFEIP
jgi:hypothetical protein